ncbi:hypothetical protein WJX73_009610 [Symbiochloris irregularis]|uniref:Fe2OG dioxygenase domain-containing protein n=1 Tax=Symbiochloris irregularis TaxID=706552 RepID=A0AAW1PAF8_9CHLO
MKRARQGAHVTYCQGAFPQPSSLFQTVQDEVSWEHKEVTVMGRRVMQPRMVAYMADDTSMQYTYSHTTLSPHAWTPGVAAIKETVEQIADHKFNSCLLNLYRTGSDHLSWHSDNEALYGDEPVIGSVSLGAARSFMLRRNSDHKDKRHFLVGAGDVLVMSGTTQQHWMHSVPKRARVAEARINLTFRNILP